MTDRPIIFSASMIRALLAGTKTQTRRVAKRQDLVEGGPGIAWLPGTFNPWMPAYEPGDRLWVRETWAKCTGCNGPQNGGVIYKANGTPNVHPWKPSIHMPRKFSRLTLTVTEVRVQRVQEISEADAVAEGMTRCRNGWIYCDPSEWEGPPLECARTAFWWLWNDLNEKRGYGWDANPWVVALTFDVHRCNIDAMPEAA